MHAKGFRHTAVLFGCFALGAAAVPAQAQVKAALVAAESSIQPGRAFTIALRLGHQSGWHTYWINPGIGQATTLTVQAPAGFQVGAIQWPAPEIIRTAGMVSGNGYTGELLLPVCVTPPKSLVPGATVHLRASATWLMCEEEQCIPAGADLELALPVSTALPQPDPQWGAKLARILEELPRTLPEWSASASRTGDTVTLIITPRGDDVRHLPEGLHFFSEDQYIGYELPQTVTREGAGGVLRLHVGEDAPAPPPSRLLGVVTSQNGWNANGFQRGLRVDVPFASGSAAVRTGDGMDSSRNIGESSAAFGESLADRVISQPKLLAALGLAFLGGLILNLMPCVFPVLGLKVFGFAQQAGHSRRETAVHGLVFTLGVLLSLWMLAGVLAGLRAGGAQLGWGFQLQSPAFVFVLAVVMLVFGLNLSGVFEFAMRASGIGANLQMTSRHVGTFFTGALATVAATPCSAPFLAPALGAALTLPIAESFAVFTAIASGLAAPTLLLSLFPGFLRRLPRPGAWMVTFKQLMAFPLYATLGWLIWILAGQATEEQLLTALLGLTAIAMGAWFYGRYPAPGASMRQARLGWIGGIAGLALGVHLGWPRAAVATDMVWEPWSAERVAQLRETGRPIYVDFTARWCATCQVNKRVVFASEEVRRYFRDHAVAALKADWTKRDVRITAELARWNRSAVPFNLIYLPQEQQPRVLPEVLTPSIVLDVLGSDEGNVGARTRVGY